MDPSDGPRGEKTLAMIRRRVADALDRFDNGSNRDDGEDMQRRAVETILADYLASYAPEYRDILVEAMGRNAIWGAQNIDKANAEGSR